MKHRTWIKPVALKYVFFCDLLVLARKLASLFDHPTQVSAQVEFAATYDETVCPGLNRQLDLNEGEAATLSKIDSALFASTCI